MAFLGKPKDEQQYGRLMGMIAPEATPSKRVGTEAPVGSVAAGPKAGQAASEFTKAGQAPGAAFGRQLKGANIGGITRLAEQPLLREAGQEATRVAQEGIGYKTGQQKYLSEQPQFKFGEAETPDIVKKLGEGEAGATETAQKVLGREKIDVPEFQAGDIKEFTPLQALRGGSVESLLKKEATGPYTTGMAGLDALLFSKKGGAADLATKGIALRTAEQATADALEKKLTEEARKEADEFVTGQKEQLSGAIKGDIESRLKTYQEGVAGIQSERQAEADRQRQEEIKNRMAKAEQIRTLMSGSIFNEIGTPELLGQDLANYTGLDPNTVHIRGAGGEYYDPQAISKAIMGVNLQDIVNQSYAPGTMQQATLADVAAKDPVKAAEYSRLVALLGIGNTELANKYGLGASTQTFEQAPQIQDQKTLQAQIIDALRKAGKSVSPIRPSGGGGIIYEPVLPYY